MNCHEFEAAWNDRLDAPGDVDDGLLQALDAHAVECPECRPVHGSYLALARALNEQPSASSLPSHDLSDRIVLAAIAEGLVGPRRSSTRYWLVGLAAAASITMAVGLTLRHAPSPAVAPTPVIDTATNAADPDEAADLTEALADATNATWDLALNAGAPAARIGRDVLDSAQLPEASARFELPTPVGPSPEVWMQVGRRLNDGVKPLEGSARKAFGFLLSSAADEP